MQKLAREVQRFLGHLENSVVCQRRLDPSTRNVPFTHRSDEAPQRISVSTMNDPGVTQVPKDTTFHSGRGVKVVAGFALLLALVCGAAAVVSFVKVRQVQHDLEETKASLDDVRSQLGDQSRPDLESDVAGLKTSVDTLTSDLKTTSDLASNIDSFLQSRPFAFPDQVSTLTSSLDDLTSRIDDVASCVDDNFVLVARQRGGQLQSCL